jgi:hypothetical protein
VRPVLSYLAIALLASACVSSSPSAAPPVPVAASIAMAEAQDVLRAGGPGADERARASLERALAAAPDWVAPRRALDEILRRDLRALEALADYRDELERGEGDAATLYLAGRLEGRDGIARFERAATLDPTLAWAWHGLSFRTGGDEGPPPRKAARRALELARDPFERTFFTQNIARLEAAEKNVEAAVELLDARAADDEVGPGERTALAVQAALILMRSPRVNHMESGVERALSVLRDGEPTDAEILEMSSAIDRTLTGIDPRRVTLALASQPGAARDQRRAEILLERSPSPLALGLLERGLAATGATPPRGAIFRTARFAAGDFRGATERWLRELPDVALETPDRPRDERLARVVESARALSGADGAGGDDAAQKLGAFCTALADAGWFAEARTVAARLGSYDLQRALDLDARALAGLVFLNSTKRILQTIDNEFSKRSAPIVIASAAKRDAAAGKKGASASVPDPAAARTLARKKPPRTLEALLDALAPYAAEVRAFDGGDADLERTLAELRASPRRSYAGIADVVVPGPTLSREDEDDGLGVAGSRAGGIAAVLDELHRFGVFGVLGGDGPDGTVLPVLAIEERSGEHLGVPWHGTVAWCEGADVPSRAGRLGARIAGAAVHEGYWIDVDQVRHELVAWERLVRAFGTDRARVDRALAVRGLAARAGEEGVRQRTSASALLDESERVRLAVLRDRAASDAALGSVTLDEMIEVCSTHEEGHLCDRTRFLPLSKHWPRALALLANAGFSAERVQEDLEYRAQLTALASIPDPRLALAQILDGVEGGFGATPHAAGYARLLDDFLLLLDGEVQRGAFQGIAPDRTLAHQLHVLRPEDVRTVALALARRKRMVAD